MLIKLYRSYRCQRKWQQDHPETILERPWLRDFAIVYQADLRNQTPLDRCEPWMNFAAIDLLDRILTPQSVVLEYGSGGSTIFFAQRAGHVYTVEHDAQWVELVRSAVAQHQIRNSTILLAQPEPCDNKQELDPVSGYGSGQPEYEGMSFRNYVMGGEAQAVKSFDVISVDGRARPACIRHAVELLKPGGTLVLDNAERDYYLSPLSDLPQKGWTCVKTAGLALGSWHWTMAQFWTRPE